VLDRKIQRRPATFDEASIGLPESGGRDDAVLLEIASFHVADRVERSQDLLAEASALLEDGVDDVGVEVCVGGRSEEIFDPEDLKQKEANVS
jgi:hypothetical protein